MFYIKNLILLICLLIIAACSSLVNLSPLLKNNNNYLIVETTTGSSYEEARSNAISLLNQDIAVSIKSSFNSSQTLNNNTYNSTASNNISLNSLGYFQDLIFSKPEPLNNGQYKISVALSKSALINTINFLGTDLNSTKINNLEYYKLNQENSKIDFLLSLLLYAKTNSIAYDVNIETAAIAQKQLINFRLINSAKLNVNLVPSNGSAVITINNKNYTASQNIFLASGTYSYTITENGYKAITNSVTLVNNDSLTLTIYLQKLLASNLNANLQIINNSNINDPSINNTIKSSLLSNQINLVNSSSNYTVKVQLLAINNTTVSRFYSSTMPVNITLLKNNQVFVSKSYVISYINGSSSNNNIPIPLILTNLNKFINDITAGDTLYNLTK